MTERKADFESLLLASGYTTPVNLLASDPVSHLYATTKDDGKTRVLVRIFLIQTAKGGTGYEKEIFFKQHMSPLCKFFPSNQPHTRILDIHKICGQNHLAENEFCIIESLIHG
jgi:hypothetical protein